MKIQSLHFIILSILSAVVLVASALAAEINYETLSTQAGVTAMISYTPLGPNNQIAADLKFVNTNDYAVEVAWTPVIACGASAPVERVGGSFRVGAGESYGITLWRSNTCGQRNIRQFKVNMEVRMK